MKNVWINFLYGYARMRIDGPYGERFLNRCIEYNIQIWSIKRVGAERIVCYIALEDVKRLRPLLRMTSCKVTFTERRGLPFFYKKMWKRGGFTAGIISFFLVLLVLSNMVWNISIEGASPKVEHELRLAVQEMGIERGTFIFMLPSVEYIQKKITDQIEDATWIGVKLNGTTFQFNVVEQTLPEKQERLNPRHLVAKKKAIVYDMFIEQGQVLVRRNDFVEKGDLLVSGFIGKEGNTQIVPAQGSVLGEIWYKSEVTIPLVNHFETLTGEGRTYHYLSIFDLDLPIWGWKQHSFEKVEIFERKHSLRLLNWTIPVQYKKKQWLEKNEVEREYTVEEAVKVAKKMAKEELQERLPVDAVIKGEKVLHQDVENGKVKLKLHYQVIEDITTEQPIIQGD
ncbi:sporulation protein YqfD [Alkalihalobacterium alkalinitrilicum]|uniref:sporulation protein YqfD n=1 Tax=Alkalihalobacterium alkalinitrilicum TaxID=427920 RepID=UPI0009957928|nr:sporulation protein YqfD [Alkalihalobacterium alkalinitrilicum]